MDASATVSPTPVETPAATPSQAPAPVSAGTAEPQSGQTPEAAPAQDTFFSGDPSSLPPELQSAYKNMLKDYKAKTSEIADVRKKAEAYDGLSKDQRFVQYWNGLNNQQKADFQEKKAEAEKSIGETISDEEFAKAFNSKGDFLSLVERVAEMKNAKSQKEITALKQGETLRKASDVVESFATEAGPDGKPLRGDFYDLDKDNLITGYLSVNPPKGEGEYQARLNEAYAWAKNVTQKYYEKGKAEALQIIQKKAAASSEMPTNAAKNAYAGPDPKKLSVREAMDLAKKGTRIPQVYD